MFTVVNLSRSKHGVGVRRRKSRVGYRDYVTAGPSPIHSNRTHDSISEVLPFSRIKTWTYKGDYRLYSDRVRRKLTSESRNNVGSRNDKRVLLLNESIYANEGKPREIAQVVDVAQIIMKDYTYN